MTNKNGKRSLQATLIFLILVTLLGTPAVGCAPDKDSFSAKARQIIEAQDPTLKLIRKEEKGNQVNYIWGQDNKGNVDLTIYYGDTEREAIVYTNRLLKLLSVGPGRKLEGLGEEAYINSNEQTGSAVIRFRKGNVFIQLSAPLAAINDLAERLANQVGKN